MVYVKISDLVSNGTHAQLRESIGYMPFRKRLMFALLTIFYPWKAADLVCDKMYNHLTHCHNVVEDAFNTPTPAEKVVKA